MRFIFVLTILCANLFGASLYLIDSVPDLQGCREIREGDFEAAKHAVSRRHSTDEELYLLKQAELAILKADYGEAKRYLLACISRSSDLAPFAYRRIGDIELLQHDPAKAVAAYRTAAEKTDMKPYRYLMVNRADSVGTAYRDELKSAGWYAKLYPSYDTVKTVLPDTVLPLLQARLAEGVTEVQFDSLSAEAAKRGKLTDFKKTLKDTSVIRLPFSTKRIYQHAQYLSGIGAYESAGQWLNCASYRPDFDSAADLRSHAEFRIALNSSLKNWENVVKWTQLYFDSVGYTSDYVLKTARAYRSIGNDSLADLWYSDYVKRYPLDGQSRDIIWYQAWQAEERGKYDSAVVLFRNIAEIIPDYKYADDASFRIGLNYFRMKKYAEAVSAFNVFAEKFPNSDLIPGSLYWQGRCTAAQSGDSAAAAYYQKTIAEWPLDYYAWRSRQALGTADSFTFSSADFSAWFESVKTISRDPADSMGAKNSAYRFRRAVQLGTLGYFDEARLLAEPIENRSGKNPAQLYELAQFYEMVGDHPRAFKLSKRVYTALPGSLRKSLPAEFMSRLYPRAYPEAVEKASIRFGVNEHLVRAIMRQESMFQPSIVSPVGAVGLMQIMPYTGRQIAKDLDTSYADKMLSNPAVNASWGTYYIGMLLKQFGNSHVSAIASYNGGPHNVRKWMESSRDVLNDEPFYSECIAFSETRTYVKKVLENYWIYQALQRSSARR